MKFRIDEIDETIEKHGIKELLKLFQFFRIIPGNIPLGLISDRKYETEAIAGRQQKKDRKIDSMIRLIISFFCDRRIQKLLLISTSEQSLIVSLVRRAH